MDFERLKGNELAILEHHGNGEYETALGLLEESQRIIKTHFGTQSSEVRTV